MADAGRVARIWIKRAHRGKMDPAERATLVASRGLAGNANQGGHRQVTFVSEEHWRELTAHLDSPDPIARRANVLLTGIDLHDSRGKTLRIAGCRIRIHGETRPCERMDEACEGLRSALSAPWGGGAYGEVLDDGKIAVGDSVAWE
jgi:MOSC domain-containing protein YiiM